MKRALRYIGLMLWDLVEFSLMMAFIISLVYAVGLLA